LPCSPMKCAKSPLSSIDPSTDDVTHNSVFTFRREISYIAAHQPSQSSMIRQRRLLWIPIRPSD
jgi:hypothetical protein